MMTTNHHDSDHNQADMSPSEQKLFWQVAGSVSAIQAVVGLIVLATASAPVGERLLAAGASGLVVAEITAAAIARYGGQWGHWVLFGFVAAAAVLAFVYLHRTTPGIGVSAIIISAVTFVILHWFYIVVSEAPGVIADLRGVVANLRGDHRDADRDRWTDA